jgi:hypothetical protein
VGVLHAHGVRQRRRRRGHHIRGTDTTDGTSRRGRRARQRRRRRRAPRRPPHRCVGARHVDAPAGSDPAVTAAPVSTGAPRSPRSCWRPGMIRPAPTASPSRPTRPSSSCRHRCPTAPRCRSPHTSPSSAGRPRSRRAPRSRTARTIDPVPVLDAARDGALANFGGELVESEPIELQGRRGVVSRRDRRGRRCARPDPSSTVSSSARRSSWASPTVSTRSDPPSSIRSSSSRRTREPPDRCQRRAGARDHRALPEEEVRADPARAPVAGAERVRHRGGDAPRRRTGRRHARRGVRHGVVLRDVPVRAHRHVPDQHLRHHVVRAARVPTS